METKNKEQWKELVEANKMIGTTSIIGGKQYAEVPQRVKAFRYLYPEGTIATEIVSMDNGVVVMKATASIGDTILATGYAYEKENSTFINKTSYIENCETSAVGRCLGFVGLGIDTSIASLEEVKNAMANQNKPSAPKSSQNTQKNVENVLENIAKATTLEKLDELRKKVAETHRYDEELKQGGVIFNAIQQRALDLQ